MVKYNYLVLCFLFLVFVGLQISEPVNAVKPKLIDHGSKSIDQGKLIWKTYQYNSRYILFKEKLYENGKLVMTLSASIKKTGKYTIKIVTKQRNYNSKSKISKLYAISWLTTGLTVRQYYEMYYNLNDEA